MKNYLIIGILALGMLSPTNSKGQTLPSGKSIADKTYTKDDGI